MKEILNYHGKFLLICLGIVIVFIGGTAFLIFKENSKPPVIINLDKAPDKGVAANIIETEKTDYTKTVQSGVLSSEAKQETINGVNCTLIEISGIKDTTLQNTINEAIKIKATEITEQLNVFASSLSKSIVAKLEYSTGNVLSISFTNKVENSTTVFHTSSDGLNYNLISKNQLNFADLFTSTETARTFAIDKIHEGLIARDLKAGDSDHADFEDNFYLSMKHYDENKNIGFYFNEHEIYLMIYPNTSNQISIKSNYTTNYDINILTKYVNDGHAYTSGKNTMIIPGISSGLITLNEFGFQTDNFAWHLNKTDSNVGLLPTVTKNFQTVLTTKYPNRDILAYGNLNMVDTEIPKLKQANLSVHVFMFNRGDLKSFAFSKYINQIRDHYNDFIINKNFIGFESTTKEQLHETSYYYNSAIVTSLDQIFNYSYKYDIYEQMNQTYFGGTYKNNQLTQLYENDWVVSVEAKGIRVVSKTNANQNLLIPYALFNMNKLK